MKITRNTPEQLIIENNPILMAVMITLMALIFFTVGLFVVTSEIVVGLVFMAVGLFIGIGMNMVFVRRTQVILDATQGSVEIRRRSWFGFRKSNWDLAHLDGATLQSTRIKGSGAGPGTLSHRAALVIDGGVNPGEHPITIVYNANSTRAERIVEAINSWCAALDSLHTRS